MESHPSNFFFFIRNHSRIFNWNLGLNPPWFHLESHPSAYPSSFWGKLREHRDLIFFFFFFCSAHRDSVDSAKFERVKGQKLQGHYRYFRLLQGHSYFIVAKVRSPRILEQKPQQVYGKPLFCASCFFLSALNPSITSHSSHL